MFDKIKSRIKRVIADFTGSERDRRAQEQADARYARDERAREDRLRAEAEARADDRLDRRMRLADSIRDQDRPFKPRGFGVHDQTPEVAWHVDRVGVDRARRDVHDATFGRGPLANKTGNPFKDDPFFNPWAKGGTFDKSPGRPNPPRGSSFPKRGR